MKMLECIKMLMTLQGVPENRLCRWRNCSPQTVNVLLNGKDIKCGAACDVLEFLGYEVIVREKRSGARREDEILIDYAGADIDPRKALVLQAEKEAQIAKEEYYAAKDAEIKERYPFGMRSTDLKEYFSRNGSWVQKYFGDLFFAHRVPLKEVSRVMREFNL